MLRKFSAKLMSSIQSFIMVDQEDASTTPKKSADSPTEDAIELRLEVPIGLDASGDCYVTHLSNKSKNLHGT